MPDWFNHFFTTSLGAMLGADSRHKSAALAGR
jgi:hypothetical protein